MKHIQHEAALSSSLFVSINVLSSVSVSFDSFSQCSTIIMMMIPLIPKSWDLSLPHPTSIWTMRMNVGEWEDSDDINSWWYFPPFVSFFSHDDNDDHGDDDWTTGGRELPSTERQRVYENGTLIVSEANRELDEGIYVCRAVNQKGDSYTSNLHIQVLRQFDYLLSRIIRYIPTHLERPFFTGDRETDTDRLPLINPLGSWLNQTFSSFLLFPTGKPTISPFRFPASLTEGMSVITTCSVLTGDPPIHVEWFKDSLPLDLGSLNVHRNEMGDLGSSLVFRSVGQSHAGNYTCLARNRVGEDTFTAPMVVRGE